ncbi:hypothetical protein VE01_04735 [Pseudogymnoascus verrucosus]|uniref:Hydrophobin n=1 Tax=Pseudogymnoascus verrucosus TaxID=342668 RepID=A0A1B8GN57_9PEZI|nr:uncharacterized protein VE01_04735 [Pseudogymnoascus verrucosus]OBT97263.1 hypothetical protein VE01_04735 [Pseudogymnoascus verrucosus]
MRTQFGALFAIAILAAPAFSDDKKACDQPRYHAPTCCPIEGPCFEPSRLLAIIITESYMKEYCRVLKQVASCCDISVQNPSPSSPYSCKPMEK